MAKIGCYCGASLSNVNCPSENIIYIIRKERVESALRYNPEITLADFVTNWDSLSDSRKEFTPDFYDFWYCTECKRVYKVESQIGGKKLAAYQFIQAFEPIAENELFSLDELIVFSDKEEDDATENDPSILLKSFLDTIPTIRYFITDDKEYVYAYDCTDKQISFCYRSESLME